MLLKRNVPTILYSFLFILFFGLGFLELVYLSITNSTHYRNVIACLIVMGIIIYLISAFFLKESRRLEFFQKNRSILILPEAMIGIVVCGMLFYLNLDKGIDNDVLILCLLLGIYLSARLLGGRLCGCAAFVMGFFFILAMANQTFDASQYIDSICFLLPYALFLFVTLVLTKSFVNNGFIIAASYLALAGIFALAIVVNPFVVILLFGCAVTLIFGKTKEKGGIFSNGFVCAIFFVLFTALFLLGANLYLKELFSFPVLNIDGRLLEFTQLEDIGSYLLNKYAKAVRYLYEPFRYGLFPSILMFLATLCGYYSIRKKTSGIGPLCLTYLVVLAEYLLYGEEGSHFYYMTYFLPVFSAYGLSNTLLPEPETETALPDAGYAKEGEEESEEEWEPEEETKSEKITEPEEETKSEKITKPEKEDTEDTVKEEAAIKKKDDQTKEAVLTEAVSPVSEEKISPAGSRDELPEWSAPRQYIPGYKKETEEPAAEEPDTEEETVTDGKTEEEAPEEKIEIVSPQTEEETENLLTPVEESPDAEENIIAEKTDENEQTDMEQFLSFDTGMDTQENTISLEEDSQLNHFLDRLDISDNIRRMNESAQEDMADVIESGDAEEESVPVVLDEPEITEDLEVLTDEEGNFYTQNSPSSQSAMPPYEKPEFDMEPVTRPITDSYEASQEYAKVPTIEDLEKEWQSEKQEGEAPYNGFAYSLKDVIEPKSEPVPQPETETAPTEKEGQANEKALHVHSEEIIKKNGVAKRSYHKITIR